MSWRAAYPRYGKGPVGQRRKRIGKTEDDRYRRYGVPKTGEHVIYREGKRTSSVVVCFEREFGLGLIS